MDDIIIKDNILIFDNNPLIVLEHSIIEVFYLYTSDTFYYTLYEVLRNNCIQTVVFKQKIKDFEGNIKFTYDNLWHIYNHGIEKAIKKFRSGSCNVKILFRERKT